MKQSIKKIFRGLLIWIICLYVNIRLKFAKPYLNKQKIVFVNVNNYPDNFTNVLKFMNILQDKVIHCKDKWDVLLKTPVDILQAIVSADIIVSTGDSPIFSILKPSQQLIYLWHACGAFKQMGVDAGAYNSRKPNWIVVSSEGVRKHYAKAFEIDINNVVALGIPRTEIFQDCAKIQQIKDRLFTKYLTLKNKKIYLYAPTYRERPFRSNVGFNFEKISNLLHEDELLIYKQHPAVIAQKEKYPLISDFFPTTNILCMDDENILELTMICDVIMTDYSTSFFEGMLLNKPCVFVADDIDIYEKGYYINYREDLPGTIVENQKAETVINAIRNATIEHTNYKKFKEFHLGACVGNISERVADFIKEVNNA